ncbi:MAG: MerR family transcriptional regulator [Sphingomonadaceae bacterium]|nr:MerR family transcriptional regulator [Sphingomonadaceae bacterium]
MGEPAYRTISDVATLVGVPHHVLRFWESKFPVIAPLKRGGNRRYYRPEDVAAIERIARLLHVEGYTVKGAQKLLADEAAGAPPRTAGKGPAPVPAPGLPFDAGVPTAAIAQLRHDLAAALAAARAI